MFELVKRQFVETLNFKYIETHFTQHIIEGIQWLNINLR